MNRPSSPAKSALRIPTSLSAKITASFAAIALLFLGNVGNNYLDANRTTNVVDRLVTESLPVFQVTSRISETTLRYEPLVLSIMDAYTNDEYQPLAAQLADTKSSIQAHLATSDAINLSGDLAASLRNKQTELVDSLAKTNALVDDISTTQKELINTFAKIEEAVSKLKAQEEVLTPLISDIVLELSDDYVISLMQELSAQANYGLYVIEKIKAAEDPEAIAVLKAELTSWIKDFKSVMRAMPFDAGDDPQAYAKMLKQLTEISNAIMEIAQGKYEQDSNDYFNGLQSFKEVQVTLELKQQQSLAEFRTAIQTVLKDGQTLVAIGFDDANKSATQTQEVLSTQKTVGLTSGAGALTFVLIISVLLTRTFRRSIREVKDDLNQLAQGEIQTKFRPHRNDEFGRINRSIEKVSVGLRDIVEGIGSANEQINDSVGRVAGQSDKTRDFAESQKEELDMVATALTEMSATANEVANHASDTHDKINSAGQLSAQGRENMKTTKSMINQVSDQSEVTSEVIHSLSQGVQNIESILSTIGGIAEQTNLLALNAAIEAARAGEQGRGFAVVADEVRALASRTQASTLEIKDMTEKMLKDSNRAVEVMDRSNKLVNQSVESAQIADETIAKFDLIMEEVLDLSRLIATASEEQAATVNELNTNVVQVSDLAEQTSESAQSSQTTSKELDALAAVLREKISKFHVQEP